MVVFVDTSILVVEDDLAVQEFIAGVLRLEGAIVVAASTGAEALSLVNSAASPYHLVVLDLRLPDITGWDVLDGIRRTYPSAADCPVVLLTASGDDESGRRAAGAGRGVPHQTHWGQRARRRPHAVPSPGSVTAQPTLFDVAAHRDPPHRPRRRAVPPGP